MPRLSLQSFNAGLLSPLVGARSDNENYTQGALEYLNTVPHVQGPASRRPGTQHITPVGDAGGAVLLFRLLYSETDKVVLELGDTYIRFLTGGDTPTYIGAPLELVTPYSTADLPAVQARNINDVVIFTHPDYPPQVLTRVTSTSFTWAAIDFDYPPLLDPNTTTTTITPSATTGTGITLTASADTFLAAHVGAFFELTHARQTAYTQLPLSANGTATAIRVLGGYSITSYGTWSADVRLESAPASSGPWDTLRSWHAESDLNINATGTADSELYLRLVVANRTAGAATDYVRLQADTPTVSGLAKITGYTSATSVTADIVKDLDATTATEFWAEGAFSDVRGYPRAITSHQARLIFAGTAHQPNTLWMSVTDDYYNFRRSSLDTGSLVRTLDSLQTDPIQWLQPSRGSLLLGTAGQEFVISSTADDNVITPTSIEAKDQTAFGSAHSPAVIAAELVLFLTTGALALREFVYSFESDRYVAPDLNLLSDRITQQGGITQVAVQQSPHLIIWCITSDGRLLGLTYERAQNVAAWHQHDTDGYFESVTVLPGTAPGWDEVYVTVRRTVDGATVRNIERLAPLAHHRQGTGDLPNLEFLDASLRLTAGTAQTTWTGLDHLEGKTVRYLADGARGPDKVVTAGAITIDQAATTLIVGLPYTSTLQPMPLVYPLRDGTSHGRKTRVETLQFDLLDTLGLCYTDDPADPTRTVKIPDRSTSDNIGAPTPLFTGLTPEQRIPGSHKYLSTVAVTTDSPYPFTLRAITIKADAHGD
jgi:hypothetical protein